MLLLSDFRFGHILRHVYNLQHLLQVTKALLADGLVDELGGDKQNILVGGHSASGKIQHTLSLTRPLLLLLPLLMICNSLTKPLSVLMQHPSPKIRTPFSPGYGGPTAILAASAAPQLFSAIAPWQSSLEALPFHHPDHRITCLGLA